MSTPEENVFRKPWWQRLWVLGLLVGSALAAFIAVYTYGLGQKSVATAYQVDCPESKANPIDAVDCLTEARKRHNAVRDAHVTLQEEIKAEREERQKFVGAVEQATTELKNALALAKQATQALDTERLRIVEEREAEKAADLAEEEARAAEEAALKDNPNPTPEQFDAALKTMDRVLGEPGANGTAIVGDPPAETPPSAPESAAPPTEDDGDDWD